MAKKGNDFSLALLHMKGLFAKVQTMLDLLEKSPYGQE